MPGPVQPPTDPAAANGCAIREYNSCNGFDPERFRAWNNTAPEGTVHSDAQEWPDTKIRITSSYEDEENNAKPNT